VGQAACLPPLSSYNFAMLDEQEIKRRRLPHWSLAGSTYFITWRLRERTADLAPAERDLVVESLLHFHKQRYRLLAYVVMNDHVHVVVRPLPEFDMSKLLHTWKSFTANRINELRGRSGALWLDERYDHLIRDEPEFVQKVDYTITNPVRRWPGIKDYQWVGWFADG
jgi:REP element-mobilizing transposase RayT